MAKFIGHTRFSLFTPGKNTWKASRQAVSNEEYAEYLYSTERLDFRKKIFLETSLPLLAQAAANHDLKHVVSFSSNLPQQYKKDLIDAGKKYDFIILDELPPETPAVNWFDKAKNTIETGEVFATYRLDDDDLVSVNFFNHLSKYVDDAFVQMIVSFGSGITAIWDGSQFKRPSLIHKPLLAIGMAEINKKIDETQFLSPAKGSGYSHMVADRGNPVILDSRGLDFFWTRSNNQDTLYKQDTSLQRIAEVNSELENATSEQIESAFPGLAPLMRYPSIIQLSDNSISVDDSTKFEFHEPQQQFSIAIEYEADSGVRKDSYRISFKFENTTENQAIDDLRVRGISKSKDPEIGHFKPADFKKGNHVARLSVALPDGFLCSSVRIIRNETEAGHVNLRSVSIQEF
ncbi:hypothetical protein CFAEC_05350 [Corynebacterium faecale]|uniref:glycosyltransferase n=1 Tax=Corynebacterium faecale TaxID=1758466 RepID=UPI0025B40221|nr:glycosyltransferase [Corynebacterium faecale]WJY91908.1 hypothetical protein CFAEC_05350 [Corynebacterium faecale]